MYSIFKDKAIKLLAVQVCPKTNSTTRTIPRREEGHEHHHSSYFHKVSQQKYQENGYMDLSVNGLRLSAKKRKDLTSCMSKHA